MDVWLHEKLNDEYKRFANIKKTKKILMYNYVNVQVFENKLN